MQGTVNVVGRAPGSFTGIKADAPAQPVASPTPPGDFRTASDAHAELSGTWTINLLAGLQTFPGTLNLDQNGSSLSGLLQSPFGTTKLNNGSIDANGFHFIAREPVAGRVVEMAIDGQVEGNEIRGTVRSEIGFARFTGTRQKMKGM